MNDPYQERQERIVDRYLQASFGLWNALITVNGILLAAVSILQAVAPAVSRVLVAGVVVACVVSLSLLVYNHVTTKSVYFRIGAVLTDEGQELSEDERRADIRQTDTRRRRVAISERICLGLLLAEAVLVLVILVAAGCSSYAT